MQTKPNTTAQGDTSPKPAGNTRPPQAKDTPPVTENGYWKDFLVKDADHKDLGGNLRHGDGQTTTPVLWRALIDRFAPRSFLDVGAGEAHAAAFFDRAGVHAHGIDGTLGNVLSPRLPIALHDLKAGPYVYPCDMTYCVEVVEHIEEQYLDNLLSTLANAPVIVMTHAVPGQRGYHHVNNQPESYWIEKLAGRGYRLSMDNAHFRQIAAQERGDSYFAKTGLVFLKAIRDRESD